MSNDSLQLSNPVKSKCLFIWSQTLSIQIDHNDFFVLVLGVAGHDPSVLVNVGTNYRIYGTNLKN